MSFNAFFRASSYATVTCGALTLAVSDGLNWWLGLGFAIVLVLAWRLEGTKRQLSERVGLVVVLLSLPLFYLDWQFLAGGEGGERVGVSALAHLILFLSSVKLLQVKADRDCVFLSLISFFEVLLAAGLSLSPLFLFTLSLYAFSSLSTILCFEIRKARRKVSMTETRLLVAPDSTLFRRLTKRGALAGAGEARRLPLISLALMLLIFALALPLFYIVPRSVAGSPLRMSGGGSTGFVGFSENVTLGDVGRLQQKDDVVMRVRIDDVQAMRNRNLRWRGVALDFFDGRGWHRTAGKYSDLLSGNERGFFQLGTTEALERLTGQTFYLEPIDTPVVFAAPRAIAVQGSLPYLRRDAEGSLSTRAHEQERISYKVYSDTREPDAELLRRGVLSDVQVYAGGAVARYLQLPRRLDARIARLARRIITEAGARNQYDAARAIGEHLQSDYGYTLDLKAGGDDPLADFLFNVREGHCEYFSTAMAVMLRTQGIPARVVIGFQMGEYNDAAGVYTVTQRDAHSWVEAYFPEAGAWVTFDPTPPAGRPVRERTGLQARLSKYKEALELLWTQYVVGYDKQEQRTLAASVGNRFSRLRGWLAGKFESVRESLAGWSAWLRSEGGEGGISYARTGLLLLLVPLVAFGLRQLGRRVRRLGLWRGLRFWRGRERQDSIIEFYERMTKMLEARGISRGAGETPLEFAATTGLSEALKITRAYNRVRYGQHELSAIEAAEIEDWLRRMEKDG